jgi:hypothetical protein
MDPSIAVKVCLLGDLKQRVGEEEYIKRKDRGEGGENGENRE